MDTSNAYRYSKVLTQTADPPRRSTSESEALALLLQTRWRRPNARSGSWPSSSAIRLRPHRSGHAASRTRLFPEVTRIVRRVASRDACSEAAAEASTQSEPRTRSSPCPVSLAPPLEAVEPNPPDFLQESAAEALVARQQLEIGKSACPSCW
jgi:hypothetical protein